jgi:UDP-glucose 4-epimerase
MSNAIITGGAGFVGSHLAEALTSRYDTIYLVDNLVRTGTTRNISNLLTNPKFVFIEKEVGEFFKSEVKSLTDVVAVYHLAATRINRCVQNPDEGHAYLADAGFEVVKYCAVNNVKLFFASTASVYNNPKKFPIEETDPCEPHTLYGAAKYYTESLMRSFAKSHNLKYSICRFFSVYGVRMDCEGAYTEIIFNWLDKINRGDNSITVFGNANEKVLDLVYVDDVVSAILKVTEEWDNEVYNVSTEEGVTIAELIQTISKVLNINLVVEVKPENRNDIEKKRVGSVERLKGLGWEPKNPLSVGILKTYEWIGKLNGRR